MTSAIVFAYSEVGARCLRELLAQHIDVQLVFTHVDDPGESRWFASVSQLAMRHRLRVEMPQDPNRAEWVAEGRRTAPDFIFSFYYRYLLTPEWLTLPRLGALNMHGSLLPKYRGRAPVHWAIIHGEITTGASLHYMLEKPDAGALVDQESVPILPNDNALDVSLKVAAAAQAVLRRSLPLLIKGSAPARDLHLAEGSYFGRRRPEDGRIDWRRAARVVHDLVRAVAPPFPGAFSEVNGCRLGILETRVEEGPLPHAAQAPCLYAENETWYADCIDGRRLKILRLTIDEQLVLPNASPAALANRPVPLA